MSVALKHTVRIAALGLLVAGLSGCGTENPVGPSMVVAPTVETAAASMSIEADPPAPDGTVGTVIPFQDRAGSVDRHNKKPKKDNPGQHRGWDATP